LGLSVAAAGGIDARGSGSLTGGDVGVGVAGSAAAGSAMPNAVAKAIVVPRADVLFIFPCSSSLVARLKSSCHSIYHRRDRRRYAPTRQADQASIGAGFPGCHRGTEP
jgi:hypothetical protein